MIGREEGHDGIGYVDPRDRPRDAGCQRAMNLDRVLCVTATLILLCRSGPIGASDDGRVLVDMPAMMQEHMLANMRDHLAALHGIIAGIAVGDLDGAAQTAESRLGMSALESHGAAHMAGFMPEGMRAIGGKMHHAASRFALLAQEGDGVALWPALAELSAACVACHAAYRIR